MAAPLKLISHKLCPYVQRAVIALTEKGIEFERIDIDLGNKPEWFLAISPLGKTPVLQVGDVAIFESAVILEYLEETEAKPLHPVDPLRRASERVVVEQVGGRVRQRVFGPVEVVGARGRIQRVANRDLVADDEHRLLGSLEQPPKRPRVAPRGVVEALAAGERIRAPVRALPGPVRLDRLALEVADVDVVEQRDVPASEGRLGGFPRAGEPRVHAQVEWKL